ncbi:MAG TPA: YfcE family phosphodiesterase [Anaerolineaceae bacterium]|nr:YfcE family phosphodiesterase [Anaerolineaceae bacterium]
MQIAVISDTHNNIISLEKAIQEIQRRGINNLIHCGDVTFSHTLKACKNLKIYLAYGNGDLDQQDILDQLHSLNPESSAGSIQDFILDRQRIFVTHGDIQSSVQKALASGLYDWVLQGHTHRFKDELYGQTKWLNPGALGGRPFYNESFAVIDTVTRTVEKIMLKEL